ncbi:MAG: histidinol-phosphatase [Omnitrophica bacterium RIFCSPLOWO2_12_FULL_50_11]|nr:MAG: histidinol-phosphatase [Omnitrophica bacterium RIFCSPLOWO2_12_FULL_50_11]
MDKKQIAAVLEEIAQLLEIKGENPFRVRAFYNGARVVEGLVEDPAELVKTGSLRKVKGIGEGLAEMITDLVQKGKSEYHQDLKRSVPEGILELLEIQGLGPRRTKMLYEELGIKNVAELEYACQENRLVKLDGFGEKSQAKILEAIKHRNKTKGYFLISQAVSDSAQFVKYLKERNEVVRIEVGGSIRRHNEIVHDIDILVSTKKPQSIHEAFTSYPEVDRVLANGETKSSVILKSGIQVDLRTVTDKEFPYALYYFTGGKEHNVATRLIAKKKGFKISEYGIFKGKRLIPCRDESDVFKTLELRYIPPELRENTGEIESAREGTLPDLVETKDIRGIFHVHSSYSDGAAALGGMIERTCELGYEYVGISDHSKTATYANGLSEVRVGEQHRELDKLQKKFKRIRIFRGIESDILADGSLDYPDRVLRTFDFVIGSIHSRFQMPEKEMTKRICTAMEHPAMTIWGHPTGRLLLGRAGYSVDYETIFRTAAKHGVAIEINANPHRLDLDWRICREAKSRGLRMSINPDAHSLEGLEDVPYGVGIARKGWLEKKDVLNTMSRDEMEAYLNRRK